MEPLCKIYQHIQEGKRGAQKLTNKKTKGKYTSKAQRSKKNQEKLDLMEERLPKI